MSLLVTECRKCAWFAPGNVLDLISFCPRCGTRLEEVNDPGGRLFDTNSDFDSDLHYLPDEPGVDLEFGMTG